jgi:Protein of unknown function (DUF3606)
MEEIETDNRAIDTAQIRIRPPMRRKVDIKDRSELMMWCRRFGLTPFQLCSIVDRVGSEVVMVQSALRRVKA